MLYRRPLQMISLVPLLALLPACSGGDGSGGEDKVIQGDDVVVVETQEFSLELRALLPRNEPNLFADLTSVDMVIEDATGELGSWTFDDLGSGAELKADEVGGLEQATISLLGYDDSGTLIAMGTTPPLDLSSGSAQASLFLPRLDDFGWLNGLPENLAGSAAVSDGDGRFLIFGGSSNLNASVAQDASAAVYAWSPLGLESGLTATAIAEMPSIDSGDRTTGRSAHTATRLGGTHEHQDLILVAGGSTGFRDTQYVSETAFLWDTAADAPADVPELEMERARFHHQAVADGSGNVVISGGFGRYDAASTFANMLTIDFFDGVNLEFREISLSREPHYFLFHGSARWGDRGVLLCGGLQYEEVGFTVHGRCGLVSPSGVYTDMDTLDIELPEPRFHHAMIGLDDGRVLVTGGATWTEEDGYTVADTAWVLDENGVAWTEVGPTHKARAQHRMAKLADGRIAIVGGVSDMSTWFYDGADALACAEVFSPGRDDFRETPPCLVSDETGAQPKAAGLPALAVDRLFGVLALGGLDRSGGASDGAAIYVPRPVAQ